MLREAGIPFTLNCVGSMFTGFFNGVAVTDLTSARQCDLNAFSSFFNKMLERGIYLPPSQFESVLVSAAHTKEDIECTVHAAREAFKN